MARNENRPAIGPGPFEVGVFNGNGTKSFPETVIDVTGHQAAGGVVQLEGTAVESDNKQGQNIKVGGTRRWAYGNMILLGDRSSGTVLY